MINFTHHNLAFEIDNNDWQNEDDSYQAASLLEDAVLVLSKEDVTKLHKGLLEYQDEDSESEIPDLAQSLQSAALSKIFKNYAKHPDSGHNLELVAE